LVCLAAVVLVVAAAVLVEGVAVLVQLEELAKVPVVV
jgi:hypothetical protein